MFRLISMTSSEPDGALLDSHCHTWRRWPYSPPVPDEGSRGAVEQLLYEMGTNGVEQAAVVCATIGDNPDNLDYVAHAREQYPGRLHVLADIDCRWQATYHAPGSVDRLRAAAERYPLAGFAHYLGETNDGWLLSDEADGLFRFAAEQRLIVSLAAPPVWQPDLRALAVKNPSVPVLCHTLGGVRAGDGSGLAEVLASAAVPSIFIKVAGLHYVSERAWDFPWPDAVALLARIFDAYGPGRLCWGSDFAASKPYTTFRQSLEVVRAHCRFFTAADLRLVLGETLRGVLATGQATS
jgi:predicted TIM-barrel fold metal-dependent hydrolase